MADIYHRIKAILIPNFLTKDPNDFFARVISERTLNTDEICESAVKRGNAPTTPDAMKINVEFFFKEMTYLLKDGFSVNTGYFHVTPHIKGVFRSILEKFNFAKHVLCFLFTQGEIMRKGADEVEVEITGVGEVGLLIVEVKDVKTGSVNDRITPNRNLRIKGDKLKLMGDKPDVGVYFINEATEEEIKVEADEIVDNKPSELVIVTPELAPGVYSLKVVTQFTAGATPLKEPRETIFDKTLNVS